MPHAYTEQASDDEDDEQQQPAKRQRLAPPPAGPDGDDPEQQASSRQQRGAAPPPPPPPASPLALLSDELVLRVVAKLSPEDLLAASQACRWLRAAADDASLWRQLYYQRWPSGPEQQAADAEHVQGCSFKVLYLEADGREVAAARAAAPSEAFRDIYLQARRLVGGAACALQRQLHSPPCMRACSAAGRAVLALRRAVSTHPLRRSSRSRRWPQRGAPRRCETLGASSARPSTRARSGCHSRSVGGGRGWFDAVTLLLRVALHGARRGRFMPCLHALHSHSTAGGGVPAPAQADRRGAARAALLPRRRLHLAQARRRRLHLRALWVRWREGAVWVGGWREGVFLCVEVSRSALPFPDALVRPPPSPTALCTCAGWSARSGSPTPRPTCRCVLGWSVGLGSLCLLC